MVAPLRPLAPSTALLAFAPACTCGQGSLPWGPCSPLHATSVSTGSAWGRRPGPASNANLLVPHVQPSCSQPPHRRHRHRHRPRPPRPPLPPRPPCPPRGAFCCCMLPGRGVTLACPAILTFILSFFPLHYCETGGGLGGGGGHRAPRMRVPPWSLVSHTIHMCSLVPAAIAAASSSPERMTSTRLTSLWGLWTTPTAARRAARPAGTQGTSEPGEHRVWGGGARLSMSCRGWGTTPLAPTCPSTCLL